MVLFDVFWYTFPCKVLIFTKTTKFLSGFSTEIFIKKLIGGLRIALAQYRELEAFAQFASDLDDATRKQLEHGQRVTEILKQPQYEPMSVGEMAVIWYVANNNYLDKVAVKEIVPFEHALLSFLRDQHQDLVDEINANPVYSDEMVEKIKIVVDEFMKTAAYWVRVGKNV